MSASTGKKHARSTAETNNDTNAPSGVEAVVLGTSPKTRKTSAGDNVNGASSPTKSHDTFVIIRNAQVFAPEMLQGKRDILMCGQRVVGMTHSAPAPEFEPQSGTSSGDQHSSCDAAMPSLIASLHAVGVPVHEIDAEQEQCVVVPGFVDVHVHVTGGGGEKGPASRTPEAQLSELVDAGVTTAIGLLGTDGVSRSVENLLVKLQALDAGGITTYMWTGAYQSPLPNLTGSIKRDISLVDKVIGVGELAISDHRGSQFSLSELARIVSDVRVAGMLAGKAGIVHCHMGSAPSGLDPLWQVVKKTALPISSMYPTHCDVRGPELVQQTMEWLRESGAADLTASSKSTRTADVLQQFAEAKVPLDKVSVSSDAYGSSPRFDSQGSLVGYTYHTAQPLLKTLRDLVLGKAWPLDLALPFFTQNPAAICQLQHKGVIRVGHDADVLLLTRDTLELRYVIARGRVLRTPRWTVKGMFEK